MIVFSFTEILISLLYAVIFGLCFSIFYGVISVLYVSLKSMQKLIYQIVFFDKILPSPSIKKEIKQGEKGPFFAFLSVLAFFLGFMLTSYFALDGDIRLYMLLLSSASFYIFYSAFCGVLKVGCVLLFDAFLFVISTTLRSIIAPFKYALYLINNKITRK